MVEHATQSQLDYSVATLPPTRRQSQQALAVLALAIVALAGVIPFVNTPLPRVDSFIPTIMAITFVTDLVTAVLLFGQFSATGSRALLVLASGYLYSSLIVIPHALTFPGAYSPTGLLWAGSQSTAWLSVSWRFGLAVALAGYGVLRIRGHRMARHGPWLWPTIYWSVAFVFLLVCALTLTVTAGDRFLPRLIVDGQVSLLGHTLNGTTALINVLALLLLLSANRTILDVWLMVAIFALVCEGAIVALFIKSRFSFGFYSIRVFSLLVSKVVLIVLLSETMRMYGKLLSANRALQSERANRLASAEAAVATVAHEIRQPLTSMIARADTGRAILERPLPDIPGAGALFGQIKSDAFRLNEVFTGVRSMFREADARLDKVDMNSLLIEAIRLMRNELEENRIQVDAELDPELPLISGSHEQLREVLLNLIQNAIEAMATGGNGDRTIRVASRSIDASSIVVSLEDTGPGIDPVRLPGIFDAFVTTKANGTGLGLGVCKMIVNRHGGKLSAASGADGGARFEITLPALKAAASPRTPALAPA